MHREGGATASTLSHEPLVAVSVVVPQTSSNAPTSGKGHGNETGGFTASEFVQYNPLELLSSHAKVGFLVILTVSTIFVALLVNYSRSNPAAFTAELTTAQVASLIIALSCVLWYVCFRVLVLRDFLRTRDDTRHRYLSDEAQSYVHAAAEFSAYMLLFFVCDRTQWLSRTDKHYDRDQFWFLWALLCIVALFTVRKAKPPKPHGTAPAQGPSDPIHSSAAALAEQEFHVAHLQRDQTEEWKGWMQIMFLWYHYFNAKDIYNAIRLYIAAYVWMTGFGNFSYYYVKRDFSFSRFCQMQWRLNFMVFWVCAILHNEYMLYYICMLHTTFTVMIYCCLGVLSKYNTSTVGITAKITLLVAVSALIWDVNNGSVFYALFSPLTWLVGYHDPYKPDRPVLHEWYFRSWLDHFVWIFGMVCAYNHPTIETFLVRLDRLPKLTGNTIKTAIVALTLFAAKLYYENVFALPKKEYNALHPYTSFIPIALFIILRNISARLRRYHLHLFEYCGKITLETYIAQFHIWMGTTGINGAPKKLLSVLPKEWPMCNFLIMSGVVVYVSLRLFHSSNALKNFVLPSKVTSGVLRRNVIFSVLALVAAYVYALVLQMLLLSYSA